MTKYLPDRWQLEFTPKAFKDLKKLEKPIQQRIAGYFEKNILNCPNPRRKGKQLSGILSNQWCYRVGTYRILAEIQDERMIILAVSIGHRREIYRSTT